MFFIHPVLQFVGILMALYIWWLGFQRFKRLYFKQKSRFDWKQHVRMGTIVCINWIIGLYSGLYTVRSGLYGNLITGTHGTIGILLIPFILFAMGTGLYMNWKKKKRKILPLIHGISNTVMLLLALFQLYSGIMVYREYVMGM